MTMNNETDKSYNATGTSSGIQTSSKPAISWKRELCILLIGMVCGASLFAIYVNFKMKENVYRKILKIDDEEQLEKTVNYALDISYYRDSISPLLYLKILNASANSTLPFLSNLSILIWTYPFLSTSVAELITTEYPWVYL